MSTFYADLAVEFLSGTETPVVYHDGQVLAYVGTHYEEVSRERLGLLARRWSIAEGNELKARAVAEVVQSVLARTLTDHRRPLPFWLDDGPPADRIIPFHNGLLDLGTWQLLPHTPEFVCPYSLPYDHDPGATCRAWRAALDEVYEGDPDRIGLLQEWAGYCMAADVSQHKMLGLTGLQRSMKSTILDVLRALVGDHNTAAFKLGQLAAQFGLQGLVGKQLAVVSEVELDGQNTAGIVENLKSITGGDIQMVNRKGLPPVSLRLPTRFTFAANRMPLLFDGSAALADRVLLLEHRVSFLGREDRELGSRLLGEIEGIAGWALDGLRRLRERGRFGAVESATADRFRRASASVDSFLVERCVVHADLALAHLGVRTTVERVEIEKERLYYDYISFCDHYNVWPKSEKAFHGELSEKLPGLIGASYRPHGKPRRYRGIAVAPTGAVLSA